ncbi:MAG: hypothetical protein M3T55_07560 [Pseudomonadota bacterium]|nr:hypothetical protein [Pseudomonadota bacterium]
MIVAQEIDIDYSASVERVLIPSAWVRAAIDAHKRIGIAATGARTASLDVADEGRDANAFCGAHGIVVEHIEQWSGAGGDIFGTVERAFGLCDVRGYRKLRYDADGLGAGIRGDARKINEARTVQIEVEAFRGSEAPFNPEGEDEPGRKNKDFFANRKAQAWWALRKRFKQTHRVISEIEEHGRPLTSATHDDLISLSSEMGFLAKLVSELSQPTYAVNTIGKILVDKMPEGAKSPNLADAVMIQFSQVARAPMRISQAALDAFR